MKERFNLPVLLLVCSILLPLTVGGNGPADHRDLPTAPVSVPPSPDSIMTDLEDYLWPTDAGRVITSTFGEYRSTHFHAGIDISTHDRTGFRVFASRDGYVARIRISPVGYGKMLYLRHRDGYFTTYAHLRDFSPALNARAAVEQQRLGCYPVDFTLAPGEFPVHKGDLIAYTGESGIGDPHLHFEIRDANMEPINPLLCPHLQVPDDIPPVIRKIAVTPRGDFSLVDGTWDTRIYRTRPVGPGRFVIDGKIKVIGQAGFAIDVRDRSNGTWFKHGVFSNMLFIDDSLFYSVRLTRVPARDDQQIGLYYDWSLLDRRRGRFERLYMETPGTLLFYRPRTREAGITGSGITADGPHSFRIVSEDFNGNTAEVRGEMIVSRRPTLSLIPSGDSLKLTTDGPPDVRRILVSTSHDGTRFHEVQALSSTLDSTTKDMCIPIPHGVEALRVVAENEWGVRFAPRYYYRTNPSPGNATLTLRHEIAGEVVRLELHTGGIFTSVPTVTVIEGSHRRSIPMEQTDAGHALASFTPLASYAGVRQIVAEAGVDGTPLEAHDEVSLYPITPGSSGSLTFDNGNLILRYDSASVYGPVFLRTDVWSVDNEPQYALLPQRSILDGGITVTVRDDSSNPKEGLFFRGRGGWNLIARKSGNGAPSITGKLMRTLGDVAVLSDDVPPWISRLRIGGRSSRRPTISFRFGDDLSGVEYEQLKMYIDGSAVIPEIEGEHHRAWYIPENPLERGPHQLSIRLKDKLGNVCAAERRFVVR